MSLEVIRGSVDKIQATNELVNTLKSILKEDGTIYLGYPLISDSENSKKIDALFMSEDKGLIAFVIHDDNTKESIMDDQDRLYYLLDYNLKKYPSLRRRRELAFSPVVISWIPVSENICGLDDDYICANSNTLKREMDSIKGFDKEIYPKLCEVLQKVSNIKPRKKRESVRIEGSKGDIIKKIEAQITNLDKWQKIAALEIPDGPQRIRGLAGSGKTIVLALKAAYLHVQHPEWNIAITFYTRSLAQQYMELVRRFVYEYTGDEPDWEKLMIMHSWGTIAEKGIYSMAAINCGMEPVNYLNAKAKYGEKLAFEGVCNEVKNNLKNKEKLFDAILIDEAQDLPMSFFKICHNIVKEPKRLIWAYDELQNLKETSMPSLEEMFGVDDSGNLNISLESGENEAKRDIILPLCYRNPPWTLALAHAIGFGIYRDRGKVQMFSELNLWEDIGYKVEGGKLNYGSDVTLVRRSDATPKYFNELLNIEDSLKIERFDNQENQYQWVANEIEKNINEDELEADDILVIFPDAYYSKSDYRRFARYLHEKGIGTLLAGVDVGRNTFKMEDVVSCSGIYRAKGNEAPMVYIVNSEYSVDGPELIKLRNILFTAITRSRAWVRICGVGNGMDELTDEINKCVSNNFKLKFKVPTIDEIKSMREKYKDISKEENKKIQKARNDIRSIISSFESGSVDIDMIPELRALVNMVKKSENDEEEEF